MRITLIMVKEMTTTMGQAGKTAVSLSLRSFCSFDVLCPADSAVATIGELERGQACARVADEQMAMAAHGIRRANQRPAGKFTARYSSTQLYTTLHDLDVSFAGHTIACDHGGTECKSCSLADRYGPKRPPSIASRMHNRLSRC